MRSAARQVSVAVVGLALATLLGCSLPQQTASKTSDSMMPATCQPSADTVCLDEGKLDQPIEQQAYAAAQRFIAQAADGIQFPPLANEMYRRKQGAWVFTDTHIGGDAFLGWLCEVTQVSERKWRRLNIEITEGGF